MNSTWYYSPEHGQVCHGIAAQRLQGDTTCRVWLPGRDSVVLIPVSRPKSLESVGAGLPDDIAYVAAAPPDPGPFPRHRQRPAASPPGERGWPTQDYRGHACHARTQATRISNAHSGRRSFDSIA